MWLRVGSAYESSDEIIGMSTRRTIAAQVCCVYEGRYGVSSQGRKCLHRASRCLCGSFSLSKNARILLSSKDGLLHAEFRDLPVRLGLQWQH